MWWDFKYWNHFHWGTPCLIKINLPRSRAVTKSYWKYFLTNLTALNQKIEITPSSAKSGKNKYLQDPSPQCQRKACWRKHSWNFWCTCLLPPPISILLLNNFQGYGLWKTATTTTKCLQKKVYSAPKIV